MATAPETLEASRSRKRTKQGVYISDLGIERVSALFHLPTEEVCKELGLGITSFKKLCRRLGINRWPYRSKKPRLEDVAASEDSCPHHAMTVPAASARATPQPPDELHRHQRQLRQPARQQQEAAAAAEVEEGEEGEQAQPPPAQLLQSKPQAQRASSRQEQQRQQRRQFLAGLDQLAAAAAAELRLAPEPAVPPASPSASGAAALSESGGFATASAAHRSGSSQPGRLGGAGQGQLSSDGSGRSVQEHLPTSADRQRMAGYTNPLPPAPPLFTPRPQPDLLPGVAELLAGAGPMHHQHHHQQQQQQRQVPALDSSRAVPDSHVVPELKAPEGGRDATSALLAAAQSLLQQQQMGSLAVKPGLAEALMSQLAALGAQQTKASAPQLGAQGTATSAFQPFEHRQQLQQQQQQQQALGAGMPAFAAAVPSQGTGCVNAQLAQLAQLLQQRQQQQQQQQQHASEAGAASYPGVCDPAALRRHVMAAVVAASKLQGMHPGLW